MEEEIIGQADQIQSNRRHKDQDDLVRLAHALLVHRLHILFQFQAMRFEQDQNRLVHEFFGQ